ncbi:MAG: hypothetical protein GX616_11720 [Planctomycetes bacterium]|mgnify:CR=1 FL=1|nr:hypothetical protein [Planctomycetota bacterium]
MATKKKVKQPKPKRDPIGREPLMRLPRPPLDRTEMLRLSWQATDEMAEVRASVESLRETCDVKRVDSHLQALEDVLEKLHRKVSP